MKSLSCPPRVPAWKLGIIASAAAAFTIAASPSPAPLPYSTGISGYSGEFGFNCNVCHFGGTTPTVALHGPKYVLLNSTRTYSFVVSGGQKVAAGLDVSVDAGTLSATDPDTYLNSGEVAHSKPRNVDSNGDAAWSFDFNAPAVSGPMKMYASGNSVNLSGTNVGDRARSTSLAIGVVDNLTRFSEFGVGLAGSGGFVPHLFGIDGPSIGPWSIEIADGLGGAPGLLWLGLGSLDQFPVFGGHFYVDLSQPYTWVSIGLGGAAGVPGDGTLTINGGDVSGLAPLTLYAQVMLLDAGAVRGISLSNALEMVVEK